MPMTLDEALPKMDAMLATLRDHAGTGEMRECCHQAATNAEALGVVLTAARENHAAGIVARTNALTTKVLEDARKEQARRLDPKRHDCTTALVEGRCYLCGAPPEAHAP